MEMEQSDMRNEDQAITTGMKEKEMQEFLTIEELKTLTGFSKRMAQIEWLRKSGWCFIINAKGSPVVSRLYCRQKMGVTVSEPKKQTKQWEPNFAALIEYQNSKHVSKKRKS